MSPNASKKMQKKLKPRVAAVDLSATVNESAVDKLLGSVAYPFTAINQTWPFSGNDASDVLYDNASQVTPLLKKAVAYGKTSLSILAPPSDTTAYLSAILNGTAPVIESAKAYLRAIDEANASGQPCTGPDPNAVKQILTSGVVGLAAIKGIEFKAHLAWLEVDALIEPTVSIGSPTTSLNNISVNVSATGELWWFHPTFHCSSLCFNWSTTWGWDRIASVTVRNIRLAADAHANVSVSGPKVQVIGVVDKLRLDYDILRDIPLEGLANGVLGGKPLFIYDASQLIATVPVLGSRFAIDSITLPNSTGSINVGVTIKQI